jgi:excisionase family DNA binding protein
MNKKEFITSREAAEMLGVALSTVQLWTENGILRAWKTGGGHRRVARQSVEEMLRQQREAAEDVPQARQLTVVVVEDKPELLRLYQRQFAARKLPVRLVTASNGFEGLVQIGRCLPEIVVTDLMMPGMDGFQMLGALRDMPQMKNSTTIVVSALGPEEIAAKGGLPSELLYFQKPVDFDRLEEIVRERMELPEAHA